MKSPRLLLLLALSFLTNSVFSETPLLTGKDAMSDWTGDAPGVRRKITVSDLPAPGATESARNMPKKVKRPEGAWPKAPDGFKVDLYAEGFKNPRKLLTAPNGDIFVSESSENEVRILRDTNGDGKPDLNESFATGLNKPFGLAFHPAENPAWLYIANTGAVVRIPYKTGDTKASAKPETLFELSGGGQLTGGGHWTRDIIFSADGTRLYTSIGSKSNADDNEAEKDRARIFESDPDGKNVSVFATGIRNPVGLAIHPVSGELWTSVNERDELGDDLVPDYITRVRKDGFYGWPWFYLGGNQDPRHHGKHPELKEKVIVPDVLLQSHSASLNIKFHSGKDLPADYANNAFACLHGSWNRTRRTGYKVIRVPTDKGQATGEYIDFLTGFVTPDGNVWGRPVGITVAKDGAILISDDGGNCIWSVRRE